MARAWTTSEKTNFKKTLKKLYIDKNLTISEIGKILGIAEQTVYDRLVRLGIKTRPQNKKNFLNKRSDFKIPKTKNSCLAEFFGIMMGDGSLSENQVMVTLGNKEDSYVKHVSELMELIFKTKVSVSVRKAGYKDVYIGSVELSKWLKNEGLVYNKVLSQVDVPKWLLQKDKFMISFLRGFFDTDGSIYKIKHGKQISFSNRSLPLLSSVRLMLLKLGYHPSKESVFKVYITRKEDFLKFLKQIKPAHKLKLDKMRRW